MDFYTLQIIKPVIETTAEGASWLPYLTAFSTPTLAAFGIWIAFNQWSTARKKLKFDLFEKRMVVYEAVRKSSGLLMCGVEPTMMLEIEYLNGIAGAQWLFDEEMGTYLNKEILGDIRKMREAFALMDSPFDPDGRQQGYEEKQSLIEAFRRHRESIDSRFAPFLSLGH